MFSRKYLLSVFLFLGLGCAKPNYQDISSNMVLGSAGLSETCELLMPNQNLCVELVWTKLPSDSEMGAFTLKFTDKSTQDKTPVKPNGNLSVVLWMPAMGHGSSPTQVTATDEGLFNVTNVFFIMPGEWEIRIFLKDGSNIIDEAIQKITL